VAARYVLMPQHIVALIEVFATRAEHIDVVPRSVNPQPPCGGELPPRLLADAVARLAASVTNLQIGVPGYPILAGDQGPR